jgi:drug/metabolite transporter (DMT)-like permease
MPRLVVFVALFAVVVWGASPVAAKIAVAELDPIIVALLRILLGGLIALPLVLFWRIKLPSTLPQNLLLLLSAFCGCIGFPVLFTLGVNLTSANHASMILASLPVFTGAIAMAWDRRFPAFLWWFGCALALSGEVLLISSRGEGSGGASLDGDLIVLSSNLFASLGYVAGARLLQAGYPASATTFWGVVLAAAVFLPFTPFLLGDLAVEAVGLRTWLAVAYLAFGVTIVGYIAWYWALGKGGIARIGLIQFLQPVSGVVLAWLLLSETLTSAFLLASAVILLGIWIAVRAK